MSIYNISGTQLNDVKNLQGTDILKAYDIHGTEVFDNGSDYTQYSISQIYNKSRENAQGMDIYGNYMVIYRDDTYSLQFVNMTTWGIDYVIPTGITSHGNDISFSSIFYEEGDQFPLLIVTGNNSWCFRIDTENLTAELVSRINNVPSDETWVTYGTAFNDDMTRLYCLGYNTNNYSDSSGFIFLETWDISQSLANPIRLSSLTREWFPCIQGVAYHDGLLWVASGMGNPVKVYALDPSNAQIVYTVDLTRTGELEGIGWGYDQSNDEYFCVYGQIYNGITYYRISFSSEPISS